MNKYTVVLDANPSTHTVYADRVKLDDGLVLFLRGTDGRNSERYDGATGIVFYAPQSLVKYLSAEGYDVPVAAPVPETPDLAPLANSDDNEGYASYEQWRAAGSPPGAYSRGGIIAGAAEG